MDDVPNTIHLCSSQLRSITYEVGFPWKSSFLTVFNRGNDGFPWGTECLFNLGGAGGGCKEADLRLGVFK